MKKFNNNFMKTIALSLVLVLALASMQQCFAEDDKALYPYTSKPEIVIDNPYVMLNEQTPKVTIKVKNNSTPLVITGISFDRTIDTQNNFSEKIRLKTRNCKKLANRGTCRITISADSTATSHGPIPLNITYTKNGKEGTLTAYVDSTYNEAYYAIVVTDITPHLNHITALPENFTKEDYDGGKEALQLVLKSTAQSAYNGLGRGISKFVEFATVDSIQYFTGYDIGGMKNAFVLPEAAVDAYYPMPKDTGWLNYLNAGTRGAAKGFAIGLYKYLAPTTAPAFFGGWIVLKMAANIPPELVYQSSKSLFFTIFDNETYAKWYAFMAKNGLASNVWSSLFNKEEIAIDTITEGLSSFFKFTKILLRIETTGHIKGEEESRFIKSLEGI